MQELVFHSVSEDNVELLQQFLASAGNSLITFRYFARRPLSVIRDHLMTVVVKENNEVVGYGHLDKENETVWLGIAVTEKVKGKGVGKQIMNYLIKSCREKGINTVHLTVDNNNGAAIQLYQKFGFHEIATVNDRSIKMVLQVNER